MMDPDATMSREEIAAFKASLKKLRDGLDDFNCQLAAFDGAGTRLSLLCQETAAACPPRCGGDSEPPHQPGAGAAFVRLGQSIVSFGFHQPLKAFVDHGTSLMSLTASVSISEFRSFAALIVAAHHTSLPLAEISS
jgi:hypothetical protein